MFAIYAAQAAPEDPLSALVVRELPEPAVREGWVRVKISHASLNRHDLFTLRGITAHAEGISFPIILGNDGVGTLDDGTPVVIYPVLGSDDWRDEETLDPGWHIFSEFVPGTFADYVAVPRRNAVPLPNGISALHVSVLGTAWLTAYRALFTKSGLRPGQTLQCRDRREAWRRRSFSSAVLPASKCGQPAATTRAAHSPKSLGAHRTFTSNEKLPHKVQAVVDNIGPASWAHSTASVARGGTIVIAGGTTGFEVNPPLLPMLSEQINVRGSIMGTLQDMKDMVTFD
jgi:NADPH:quinone reductase-like Zn-dependent oxidoreductase